MKHKHVINKQKVYLVIGALSIFLLGTVFSTIIHKVNQPRPLATHLTGGKEIERKWLLEPKNIPVDLEKEAVGIWDITQTYLNLSPEVRIRKIVDQDNQVSFIFTVKSDMSVDGLTREEKEWYISEAEYEDLLEKKEGSTIQKTRYRIDKEGRYYEYDIFHEQLDGLAYLEIEFTDETTARDFVNPEYAVKDVTSDKRYKNQRLAQNGIPQN